jgi:phenylalanyl-tRNA synthetase alpha chain
MMKTKLDALLNEAIIELDAVSSEEALQELRVKYLGKKGALTSIMKGLGEMPAPESDYRQVANLVKIRLKSRSVPVWKIRELKKSAKLQQEFIDVTCRDDAKR